MKQRFANKLEMDDLTNSNKNLMQTSCREMAKNENKKEKKRESIEIVVSQFNETNNKNNHKSKTLALAELPGHIPESTIMQEKNLFNKIGMIMDRYILDTAQLQVNISSLNRQNLNKRMQKLAEKKESLANCADYDNLQAESIHELYVFFDDSCVEILQLLHRAFRRFADTQVRNQSVCDYFCQTSLLACWIAVDL